MSLQAGRFAAGLALKSLLKRFTGRAEPAALAVPRAPLAHRPVARKGSHANPPARPGVPFALMIGSIALALPLMLLFEGIFTRIAGVILLFTFIVAGVFAIADPGFLQADDEERP